MRPPSAALGAEQPPAIRDAFQHATDAAWTSRGAMDLKAQAFAQAFDAFRQAVTLNSRNVAALSGLSDAAGGAGTLDRRTSVAARNRDTRAGQPDGANRAVARAGGDRRRPGRARDGVGGPANWRRDEPRAAEQLASVLADAGDGERLAPLADAMVARFPDRLEARYYRATALYLRGKHQDAVEAARLVVKARPDHARAQSLLGAACVAAGQRECALAAFTAAIQANPREASGYLNAGLLSLQSGNASAAADFFASALTIDPSSTAARDGLAQTRSPKF